eukprot:TRINITY_DN1328_c0_g1_i1.p1 TRINITY_DN1328_c0_g1~~TRINITY_DN1328_c0_g1_i1.p1  ORF type:complete len:461 (+),score=181.17 TRINITY_DN1328_c0_g1_i1:55-1437(+)
MALVARLIPSVTGNDPRCEPFKPTNASARKEKILQATTHSSMVGILAQMAWLADYSHEIFSGLNDEARSTYTRMTNLSQQLSNIESAIPRIEKMVEQKPLQSFFNNPRAEFSLPLVSDAQVFTADSQSKSIKQLYAQSKPPPPLHKMDKYMDEGKKCLEMYTNPKFFLDEWIAEQMKIRQAAKEARRKRREEGKLKAAADPKSRTQLGAAQPKKIVKTVFNPVTGEKMYVTEDSKAPASPNPGLASTMNQVSRQPSATRISTPSMPSTKFDDAPALPTDEFMPPPPPPMQETPRSMPSAPKMATPEIPRPAVQMPPSPQQPVYHTPTPAAPPPAPSFTAAPAPPPPPQFAEPPPPPMGGPMPTSSVKSGPSANFLDQLQGGVSLKPAAPSQAPKPADGRSNLMEGIRKGIALKSAEERKLAPSEPSSQPSSVAAILSLRIAFAGSDDDSSDEEEDEEWAV